MRQPATLLGMGVGTALLLAMLSLPPSRALGAEGNIGDGNVTGTPSAHATPRAATLNGTYSNLPMSFEKNAGQSRSGADFIARGSGYSVFLTSGEAVLAVRKQTPPNRDHDPVAKQADGSATIRMTLVSSSPARAAGEGALPAKANYFIGNDPARWKQDVPTFAKVLDHTGGLPDNLPRR